MFFDVCAVMWNALVTSCTLAHQAPPSMIFSRPEYWSRLPFSSPGNLPDPGIEPMSPVTLAMAGNSLPMTHLGNPLVNA